MADSATAGLGLGHIAALLAAGVVAVPIFRRFQLGSVLGYLAAGLLIGPFGLALFREPETILHVAEFGVVIFLFIIGLEMRPTRLWSLRKEFFGLGAAQVFGAGLLLTFTGMAAGLSVPVAFVVAMGFVLSSTAVIMQMLDERGEMGTPRGSRAISILLLEDLAIVPLLAVVAVMASVMGLAGETAPPLWRTLGLAIGAVAIVFLAGKFLINPVFRILARYGGREVMTAAALLVVVGAAWLMDLGGLSMAMGAFLAGVLLSESNFRHQLEADVEPFRGLLLGLFFLGVGMALDLDVVRAQWPLVLAGVLSLMLTKALCIYAVARLAWSSHADALDRAVIMAQGGEFAFVLYNAAQSQGVISGQVNALMTAVVVVSMALTPLAVLAHRRLARAPALSLDGVEAVHDSCGSVLIIGFGRFGQLVSQGPLARGADITIIDADPETVRDASRYGFKVYYGDGTRPEVLHAAGAHQARVVVSAIDDRPAATRIAEIVKAEFPQARLLVRAFDREHARDLVKADADVVVREVFESSLLLGGEALKALGASDEEAGEIMDDIRRRDAERFALEVAGDRFAGRSLVYFNQPAPPADDAR